MVYILFYAIIILNSAHIFAYGTISRVSSRIKDNGVMNKRVLHFALSPTFLPEGHLHNLKVLYNYARHNRFVRSIN